MINERIALIDDEHLREVLSEIETVTGVSVAQYESTTLLSYLVAAQRDMISDKRRSMDASRFYNGSYLKTKIAKLPEGGAIDLVNALCQHFRVSFEFVEGKSLYVFLNEILNSKSKLRKPPPIRL